MGLLTHEVLPYRFERAGLGIAESLLLEVTLWQSCLVVGRGYYKASVFGFCGGSNGEFVILRSQLWKVRVVGGVCNTNRRKFQQKKTSCSSVPYRTMSFCPVRC